MCNWWSRADNILTVGGAGLGHRLVSSRLLAAPTVPPSPLGECRPPRSHVVLLEVTSGWPHNLSGLSRPLGGSSRTSTDPETCSEPRALQPELRVPTRTTQLSLCFADNIRIKSTSSCFQTQRPVPAVETHCLSRAEWNEASPSSSDS